MGIREQGIGRKDNMKDFIETRIINAVQEILIERINEILCDMTLSVPAIEFSEHRGSSAVVPVITLSNCERTEKERIISIDAYSLTVTFTLPETPESELLCYTYSGAVSRAIYNKPTWGEVADRVIITGKKYLSPKKPNCGEGWQNWLNRNRSKKPLKKGIKN